MNRYRICQFYIFLLFIGLHIHPGTALSQNIDSLKLELTQNPKDSSKFDAAIKLYYFYQSQNQVAEAESYLAQAKNYTFTDNANQSANRLNNLLQIFMQNENYDSLVVYSRAMAELFLANKKPKEYLAYMNQSAYYYTYTDDNEKSVKLLLENLRFAEQNNITSVYSQIYMYLGFGIRSLNFRKAKEYFEKSLMSESDTTSQVYFTSLHEIGNIYVMLEKPDSALMFYLRSLKIKELLGDYSIIFSYHDISLAYKQLGELDKAIDYIFKCINSAQMLQEKYLMTVSYTNLASMYTIQRKFDLADSYFQKSLSIAKDLDIDALYETLHFEWYNMHKAQGNYKLALGNLELMLQYSDSIKRNETEKQIADLDKKYQTEKKEAEILILQQQKIADDAIIRNQQIIGVAGGIIIILSVITAFVFFRGREKQKRANELLAIKNAEINQQKEEIMAQSDNLTEANIAITSQKEQIEESHRKITDSIAYASRIQQALLPSQEELTLYMPEHFVLYKPKDVVSGDFYYFKKIDNMLLFAVADCTGHGVPGAMVSMLGIAFLNEIVRIDTVTTPAMVLEELRLRVKASLKHSGKYSETRDGMDIAFCALNSLTGELQYAGANNSLYIVRNGELIELKATSNPIGAYIKEVAFENNSISLQHSDMIYMFSDGYYDQFGGENDTKMMKKNFKQLLQRISNETVDTQKIMLSEHHSNWKNKQSQNDDVLVMGIRYM